MICFKDGDNEIKYLPVKEDDNDLGLYKEWTCKDDEVYKLYQCAVIKGT